MTTLTLFQEKETTMTLSPELGEQRQAHEYARHTFGILVQWFTFFITINYAVMGWLAATKRPKFVVLIATLFVIQNLLGICAELVIFGWLQDAKACVDRYDRLRAFSAGDPASDTCMPIRVYRRAVYLMIAALGTILVAWILFPILSR